MNKLRRVTWTVAFLAVAQTADGRNMIPTVVAQEVDAIYLETQATAQNEAVQRVRQAIEPHLNELGRNLVILSDLSGSENSSIENSETRQRAYRALGQAFVNVVERFLDGVPQIASRFDSISGYIGELTREVEDAVQELSVELEEAEQTVQAVADTLRLVRRWAASGRDGHPCDIDADDDDCSERTRRAVAELNRESMRAFARVQERRREKDELEQAETRLAEIRQDVINRKRELTELRGHLTNTAAELATRLAHRDRIGTVNRVTRVWGEAAQLSLLVRDSLTSAIDRVWGDLGRAVLLPWTAEQATVAVKTADAVRAILARTDSLQLRAATGSNER